MRETGKVTAAFCLVDTDDHHKQDVRAEKNPTHCLVIFIFTMASKSSASLQTQKQDKRSTHTRLFAS